MFAAMASERSTPPSGSRALPDIEAVLNDRSEAILEEQVEIAETPAPPFQEERRARLLAAKLEEVDLPTRTDEVGNLLVRYPPDAGRDPATVVAAHLDTVFGPETPLRIRNDGDRWIGPGIADNARGLAVTLTVLRALVRGAVRPDSPLLFAFTVGEEGPGDLRGAKHLVSSRGACDGVHAFIAVDGSGLSRIVHRALGSRRFRVSVRGPGGHSWTDWGRPNPAHVVGGLIERASAFELPADPRVTLTIARLGGGTSVNAIPETAWVEIDVRSESTDRIDAVEARIRGALDRATAAERTRNGPGLEGRMDVIGSRPAGALPPHHPLVAAAAEATRALGVEPDYTVSSTDANVALARGIPAIAIGAGGRSGNAHTENEWFEDTDGAAGAVRLAATLAAVCGF